MFEKLKSVFRIGQSKAKGVIWQDDARPGYPSNGQFFGCAKSDSYDNSFADIVRIAEAFAEVKPYAVDEKGRRLTKQPPLMRALYNPNGEMSGSDFLETLITMMLVHPLVHILVWRYEGGKLVAGGPITPKNIAGFTFLENASVSRVDGKTTFRLQDKTYTTQDVITMSLNVNPYRTILGYSPSQAIKKWATVDDYIAEYQAGQFKNGGVPAGLMTITASSVEVYNQAVDKIIAAHTGPSNANRVIYTHRPTSTIDGKPMAAGVEWTPFAQTNKEMTLEALFNQANKKIDMNFGVPEEVKGYLQNSNYASAEVADYVFARRVVAPKLAKVYAKFTHEMNRITGGLGFAISYDYDMPMLTDTRKVQAETIASMLNAGFTIESIVEALQLPRSYLKLAKNTETVDENLQVEDTASEKPSQAETSKGVHDHDCGHEHCHHSKSADNWEGVINPTLKSLLKTFLVVVYSLVLERTENNTLEIAIAETAKDLPNNQSANILRTLIVSSIYYQLALNDIEYSNKYARQLQIEVAPILTDAELREFNLALQATASQVQTLVENGDSLDNVNTAQFQDVMKRVTAVLISKGIYTAIPDFADGNNYEQQLNYLLQQFAENNLEIWEKAAASAIDLADIVLAIEQSINDGDYRLNRWALTEQHRSEELGKLLAAKESGDIAEMEPYKIWRIQEGACASCVDLAGVSVRADQEFPNGNMVPSDHPNCRCYFDVEFKPIKKSVKVSCPHCKRYMFESNGGSVKNVICANSKCKRHYDIEVKNNKVIAKERSAE